MKPIFTQKEIKAATNRAIAADMLLKGSTFAQVERITGMSPITITRVNKWLKGGKLTY